MPESRNPAFAHRKLIPVTEAAEYCGVTHITIRRWIDDGTLRAYRVGPTMLRIDAADLDSIITVVPVTQAKSA